MFLTCANATRNMSELVAAPRVVRCAVHHARGARRSMRSARARCLFCGARALFSTFPCTRTSARPRGHRHRAWKDGADCLPLHANTHEKCTRTRTQVSCPKASDETAVEDKKKGVTHGSFFVNGGGRRKGHGGWRTWRSAGEGSGSNQACFRACKMSRCGRQRCGRCAS